MIATASLTSLVASHAQVIIDWVGEGDNNLWSNPLNWADGTIPDNNGVQARFNLNADTLINIDQDYTINRYVDGGAGQGRTHSLYGPGVLTLDANNSTIGSSVGIDNATTGDGGTFRIGVGNIRIANSQGTPTTMRNQNSSGNIILFDEGSTLTLGTILRVVPGSGVGLVRFNGIFAPSQANIQFASPNVQFGATHDSSEFGADIVLLPNSRLTINGGTVLSPGQKFQVNGNAELVFNSADSVNGAYIVLGAANNLSIFVLENQSNLGHLVIGSGTLTLDIDPDVTNLSFGSSFSQAWGGGEVVINGFKEDTIRFGTNGVGLNRDQLDVINGGIYSLTDEGYLTETSIERWAKFAIDEDGFVSLSPWLETTAFVNLAPFILLEEAGWVHMEESVAIQGNGWFYSYDLDAMDIFRYDESGFGYSLTLERWVFTPEDSIGEETSWIYLF